MEQLPYQFEFSGYEIHESESKLVFNYAYIYADGKRISFQEKLILPPFQITEDNRLLVERVMENLLLILGISYWKLYAVKEIVLPTITLSQKEAQFWYTIYTIGLGEFYYRNGIDLNEYVSFPYSDNVAKTAISFTPSHGDLVGIGGGKDSIVSVELLKKHGFTITGFEVYHGQGNEIIDGLTNELQIPILSVKREIDPKLIEFTKKGGLNGHVPVSAKFAFVGLLLSVLFGYRSVIVSNERSADSGNIEWKGRMINHQWSKTTEFELLFREYVQNTITPSVSYFSLLRPFSELQIVQLFSKYPQYFSHFTSCNRSFRISPEHHTLWCGECAKCSFVFAMLAAYVSKESVVSIFQKNLFEDANLLSMYKDLLGRGEMKPFDCVGTFEETQTAFLLAHQKGEYEGTPVMEMFKSEVLESITDKEQFMESVLQTRGKETVPEEYRRVIESE